ncbi:MAG TPA: DUF2288 domain-containing protein [Cellvibrio sp.]|nr:DUF2288 domain-containing protein [Cellvibrio sp.]
MTDPTANETLSAQLNLETAQIHWHELQRFFASGNAIAVDKSLDLTYVAAQIAADNAVLVKQWMADALVDVVKDEQARQWYQDNSLLWAVVIKPWVLVQHKSTPSAE